MTALCPWDQPVWGQARPIYERSLSQAELWLIDTVLRGHRQGRGQPALCCLHREIASKRPAACVKKILHSGSAQMNPGGAWNCFQWHSSQFIIAWWNSVTNDICKCGFSWRFRPGAWYICLYLHMKGVTGNKNRPVFLLGYILHFEWVENNPPTLKVDANFVPSASVKRCQSQGYLPALVPCSTPASLITDHTDGLVASGLKLLSFDLSWKWSAPADPRDLLGFI